MVSVLVCGGDQDTFRDFSVRASTSMFSGELGSNSERK